MFRFNGFSKTANNIINTAINESMKMGHKYVGGEHLILGFLKDSDNEVFNLLVNEGITYKGYYNSIKQDIGVSEPTELGVEDLSPECKKILEMAIVKARMSGNNRVEPIHIFFAFTKDDTGFKMLRKLEADPDRIINALLETDNAQTSNSKLKQYKRRETPHLDKYCIDLTQQAQKGELDPVIGRDFEIKQVIETICRRIKNNPCLVGEAGVGKTAIIEGLSQMIVDKNVPEKMYDKRVMLLDISSMVAGSKYRGDFEEKVRKVINEVCADNQVLLFIDEIHTIVGAGAAEGAIDAANILKPYLSHGSMQVIGATTFDEYRKSIEKDSALERRFQKIKVEIPNVEQTIEILQGIKSKYEEFHGVCINNDALESAAMLSDRYITERNLPDKAIDLIDTAAARLQIEDSKENEDAGYFKSKVINKEHITKVISDLTGIDITELTSEQTDNLINLEDTLHKRVIGQHEAISLVANAIRRGRVGLKDPNRPIGSFVFLGSTGVGKTELCLALSEALFQSNNSIIRMDMSEYMEKHSVSKLIGSPAGYIGYDDGGQLTEKVRQKPYSVVLFDEIEKAYPDVLNILLQVLEDGTLQDSHGINVSFKNTVVVMTSNVGADHFKEKPSIGFNNTKVNTTKSDVMDDVKNLFRPEFINRIDDVIVFHELTTDNIKEIVVKMLDCLSNKALDIGVYLDFTNNAIDQIVAEGYNREYGARPLRRFIQKNIEDLLANQILTGDIKSGDSIVCDFSDEFIFEQKQIAIAS